MTRRLVLLVSLAVAAAGLAIVAGILAFAGPSSPSSGAFRGSTPPPKIGLPSFALTDALGDRESPVRASDLEGKAVALTFLDSECTDVCPLMAPTMAAALDLLGPSERSQVKACGLSGSQDLAFFAASRLECRTAPGQLLDRRPPLSGARFRRVLEVRATYAAMPLARTASSLRGQGE